MAERPPFVGTPAAVGALNAELPIHRLASDTTDHFVRNNGKVLPELSVRDWSMNVRGLVESSVRIDPKALASFERVTHKVLTECAGNGRQNSAPGVPWDLGAIGIAEWTGVPLRTILAKTGLKEGVKEIVFEGVDVTGEDGQVFTRSIPVELAMDPEAGVTVAYQMNGGDIPQEHGGPVRLIVPTWSGMASVKFLSSIEAIDYNYVGPFQGPKYSIFVNGEFVEPVREKPVRSVVFGHDSYSPIFLRVGDTLEGLAWSGMKGVDKVEVSNDGGKTWKDAIIDPESENNSFSAVKWSHTFTEEDEGFVEIVTRATDKEGRLQPKYPNENDEGYQRNGYVLQRFVGIIKGPKKTERDSSKDHLTTV